MMQARRKRNIFLSLLSLLFCLFVPACAPSAPSEAAYRRITPTEAKAIMDEKEDCVILDVRTQEEYVEGHIPGAILLPDYEIAERAESVLTDKSQCILVYCRSGRRSEKAARTLVDMGYTYVLDFGGILDWTYGVEK